MENIRNNANKDLKKKEQFGNLLILYNQRENIEKIEKEHRDVIEFISNLNKNEANEVLVPVCDDFAYFVGKIKNANECKIYLGEDYFLKTSSEKVIKILSNRLNKTNDMLGNLDKEISKEKDNEGINENKENSNELKQLHDNTFEIVEEISYKDLQNMKNTNKVKQTEIDEKKIEKIINEKLQKLKEFKNQKETPMIMSVLSKKQGVDLKLSNTQMESKIENKNSAISDNPKKNFNSNSTKVPDKKKKDILESNINPQIYSRANFDKENENYKPQKSYFYNLDVNEL